ncbi:MAG: VOC family protein [Frankiales bacterium]|nr:VOC family protein [Frankiales bacterium]
MSDDDAPGAARQKVTPCLWFRTDGEAALRLYTSLVPGSQITSLQYSPGPDGEATLLAGFTLGGVEYRAIGGPAEFGPTEAFSLSVACADQAEVDRYWDALVADGGEEGPCGWLKDRWGVSWQIVPDRLGELLADRDPARAGAALQAMFGMTRIVVADLEAAADSATQS